MPEDLNEHIEENAAGPKSVTVDGTTTTAHSLREQIEAADHLDRKAAAKKRRFPFRLSRTRPGGAA